ncbi:MAG TPA: tripartite tricarboxylate transporter TctB family protein [Thermodesulfobacteriota bacterium]
MTYRDWYGALAFLLASAVVAVGAIRLGVGTLRDPGPGFAPLVFATALGLLAAIRLAGTIGAASYRIEGPWLRAAAVCVLLLAWGLAVETVGYLVATFLATVGFVLIGGRSVYAALAFGVGAILTVEFVFVRWLATPLPRGVLF